MLNNVIGLINDVKSSISKNEENDSLEKIIVFNDTDRQMNKILMQHEHDRMKNIHNLDAYFDLVERNDKRFHEVNNYLHNTYGRDYQKEVLKEIALALIIKKCTLHEIGELYKKHENPTKGRNNI